ncbi:MAG: CTP synthase, partial [Thermodesulfobacteriota bacterium]|nr:CTP synthase [Thermodesulfobacteriota bacterium]
LRAIGIQPDILLCRTDRPLDQKLKAKISLFCNVDTNAVITAKDVDSIYEVPLCLHDEGVDEKILDLLNVWTRSPRIQPWKDLVQKVKEPKHQVLIAIIGKYVDLTESYKSLHEALVHGGVANDATKVELRYVNAEDLESGKPEEFLAGCHGILVPGGFGHRGVEGKIRAITYARKNKIPFFGICLGMQLAVIEFARSIGMKDADSIEFNSKTKHPVIYLMKEWFDERRNKMQIRDENSEKGGTLRLGSYPCRLAKDTFAHEAYGVDDIDERHRHRYEFNNEFREQLEAEGLVISGASPDNNLVEIVELKDQPWFLGCQFHPEFKSRPMDPHPLFREFIRAGLEFAKVK